MKVNLPVKVEAEETDLDVAKMIKKSTIMSAIIILVIDNKSIRTVEVSKVLKKAPAYIYQICDKLSQMEVLKKVDSKGIFYRNLEKFAPDIWEALKKDAIDTIQLTGSI